MKQLSKKHLKQIKTRDHSQALAKSNLGLLTAGYPSAGSGAWLGELLPGICRERRDGELMLGRGGVNGAGCCCGWETVAFDPLKLIFPSLLLILLYPGWGRGEVS